MATNPAAGLAGDHAWYLSADEFFPAAFPTALTYDDVSLATLYSEVLPAQTKLETVLSERLHLHIPVLSADMDTVTEAPMAIAMAQHGGMGLIHANLPEKMQIKEVARVKNHVHGLIQEPITVRPDETVAGVLRMIEDKRYNFRTFPVTAPDGGLLGLLSGPVVKYRYRDLAVAEAMTPRSQLLTISEAELGNQPVAAADRFFAEHVGIHKLLVVNDEDKLRGLFTLSDIERIIEEEGAQPQKPARDSKFRLVCGASLAPVRLPNGELDRARILRHVEALVAEGVDAVAISTAHGFSKGVGDMMRLVRSHYRELTIIAGNVTSAAGVDFLADAGADAIKVGQGPGSICTTRTVAGVGIPQLSALYVCSKAARRRGVRLLADGGISKSGDMVKALTLADAVICGSLLAGCREAPGQILEINGKFYKQYRGMGSEGAMKAGSAARYGHDTGGSSRAQRHTKVAAEGVEALKEVAGSVDEVLAPLVGGIQSGLGYLGARDLAELRAKARYVRVTPAGMREAGTHDIIEIKTAKE